MSILKLFWERNENFDNSWKIKTKVKLSSIPGSGNGRFTLENIKKIK